MRLAVVARGLPELADPTLGRFEVDQALALAGAGHQVVVVALDVRSARRGRRLGRYTTQVEGLPAVVVSLPVGAVGPRGTELALRLAWRLARRSLRGLLGGDPDLVHAHFSRFGSAVRRGLRDRYRLVVTEHSSRFGQELSPGEDAVARRAYAAADAVVAVSPWLAQRLQQDYQVPARVVADVVDVDAFRSVRPERPPGSPARLVSAAFFTPRKRLPLLGQGYALARPELDATLTVIGEGPDRAAIEAVAVPGVELTGALPRSRVAEELARADGFVLLSEFETFGVVYAEAMASGLPVLASRCGGPEGFVNDDVGVLTDASTPEQVAEELRRFVGSLGDYDPEIIRAYARTRFAPEVVAQELTKIYRELLDGPQRDSRR